jgi:hypothetical protein
MSEVPLESAMATGNDEGTAGEHIGLGQQVSDESAPDDVIAAVEDDAPLPAEGGDKADPDTPQFREP